MFCLSQDSNLGPLGQAIYSTENQVFFLLFEKSKIALEDIGGHVISQKICVRTRVSVH